MAYTIIISVSALLIAFGNFLREGVYTSKAFGVLLITTVLGIFAVILIDGIFAFFIRRLPEKWFAPMKPIFSVSERETRFYRRIRIAKWKKFVPELGCFTGFHKDKLRDSKSSAYLGRFLLESNYGVLGHIAGAFAGFLLLFVRLLRPRSVALPIAIVNFILNLMPTAVLRSNTPALRRLYARSLVKEAKQLEKIQK